MFWHEYFGKEHEFVGFTAGIFATANDRMQCVNFVVIFL